MKTKRNLTQTLNLSLKLPLLMLLAFTLAGANQALAAATVSTAANASISADTAGGAYTALTGPVLTEGANGDISTGTIVLNAPSGFVFDTTASSVTATVTKVTGTGNALEVNGGTSQTVTPTSTTITITVSKVDTGSAIARITWSGIRVRPSAGTPLASGNITNSGTATISGISGASNFGTLTEVPGALNHFTFGAIGTQTVGTPFSITITALDLNNNTVTGFGGTASLTTTAGTISPTTSGTFTAGVLSGQIVTVTGAGASQTITASASGKNGTSAAFIVNKADPTVTTWPTASAITYGQTLADSTLSGGVATPAGGTFTFTTPSTAPNAGTAPQSVTYTPTDTANYNTASGTVSVTVAKANSVVTVWPTASTITYGQTLADSTLTGGTATPAGGTFAFTTPSTAPNAGTALQSVTYTPTDTANYNPASGTVSVTVDKANSVVTVWATASAIAYGQTLADSTLTGGTATPAGGTFAFTTPSTAPAVGTASEDVTYTPTDTANYNPASGTVSVTVNKATLTVTATGLLIYGSDPSTAVYTPSYAGFVGSDTNSVVSGSATYSTDASATSYVGNGYYARVEDVSGLSADNYAFAAGPDGVLVVTNRPLTVTNVVAADKPYDGTTDVVLDLSGAGLDSLVNDDAVTLDTSSVTAAFVSPNAGLETVMVSGLALDGDLATNYTLIQPTTTATITKADPTVTTWPTASAITYGQTLADSVLSDGVATPDGSFAFTTPSTAPNAGTAPQSVTFTPTDTDNYNTASDTVSVTVNKADSVVTVWPTASTITYGQTLADSTLTGGAATPDGSFGFTTPSTVPNAGTALQSVTYTPTDTDNYNPASGTASVTVDMANSVVTVWPTASTITYGQTLADSTLTGGTATPAEGTFVFTTPSLAPDTGTASQSVTYMPADSANYNPASGTVSVTVAKATPLVTVWPTASAIAYGQTLADSTLTGGTATPAGGTFTFTTPSTAPAVGTASEGVTYTPTDTANYNPASGTVSVTVNKATLTVTATGLLIYGSDPSTAVYTPSYAGFVGSDTNSVVSGSATYSTDASATSYVGNGYYARVEDVSGLSADNYAFAAGPDGVLVVTNRSLTVTNVVAADKPYDGTTDVVLDLSGAGLDGLVNDDAVTLNTSSVTAAFVSPNAGLETVMVSGLALDGDLATNYTLIQPTTTATITKADPTVTTWPTASAITYGQTLADSVLSGGVATPDGSFAFTTPSTAPNAGTAPQSVTYTPTDTDNYNTASGTVSVTVNKADSVVTVWPTASTITYGQTLADSTLTGGTATPTGGTYAFTTPSTAPNAGTASQSVTYTPTDTANYNPASGTVSVTVDMANSAAALVSSQNPSLQGSNVTFTVTVTPVAPASTTPTGSVQFYTNDVALGSPVALTIGVATLSTAGLPAGTTTVKAEYVGDSNFLGSTGSVAQVVSAIQMPITVGIENNDDGTVTVSFSGTPGAQYIVQAKSDLGSATPWVNVSTNTAGTDGTWTFEDSTSSHTLLFYRSAIP